ncbi:MAG TPA: Plug domain-containing protein, partial [Gammaproteobacteria bacterium]|nr:Plug domain-containing protein [Gammaproteobacteria bacterium]
MKISLLEKVTGFIVTLSVTALIITMPAMSQDDDEDAAELGTIQITGSRLKQTDIETARPVTVITREQIELSGFETVAQVLQNTPYNSFGSFRETSGYANGQAVVNEISLRGLGSQRTLLLLDGRRVSGTGGSGGAAANLNQIPLAIVERIDI